MKKMILFLVLLSTGLVGCTFGASEKKLVVELSDFKLTPNQFTVQMGSEVTVIVTNNGIIKHDFTIMQFGTDVGDMFDAQDQANILWSVSLQPGETKSLTFTVPGQVGAYQVVCAMPGHLQSGMVGTLQVYK